MRRYYDRYRRRRNKVGFLPKVILVLCAVAVLFLYRETILGYLEANPGTAKYVPGFVTSALERDLEDWKEEDLQARYQQLSAEMKTWQSKLETAAAQGQAKFEEVQAGVAETKAALDETKAALDKLSAAGGSLKSSVSAGASSPDSK